jgi:hypothetical protein
MDAFAHGNGEMLEKEMSRQDARIKKQEKQVARSSRFHEMQVTCRFPHCIGHQGVRREAGIGMVWPHHPAFPPYTAWEWEA